ncbi:acetyltransferase [Sulfitobacter sp. SK012]|nr:acetyltransferase [Sulfitobacter sp. SK012]
MVDSFVKIKPVGGNGDLILGERVYINSGCVLYTGNGLTIGNDVAIAANCTFAPVNHEYVDPDIPIINQGFRPSKGGIVIEDDVWIGAGVVFLDGAIVRKGCVIGAQSVVRSEIPAYHVAAGNPAVPIKARR